MNEPRVTSILQENKLIDFSMVRKDIMERACTFGSACHKATELHDLGTLDIDSLDPAIVPYLEGWKNFLKDYGLTFTPEEIEQRLVSKRHGFTGAPDRWHTKKGLLIDIKSTTAMYPATAIQTMAYQMLIEETLKIKIKKRIGVQLTGQPGKGYKIAPYKDTSDKSVFLSCLNVYRWKQRKGLIK